MREHEAVETLAAHAVELYEENSFPHGLSRSLLGQARVELGRTAEGIALMRQGIDDAVKIGTRTGVAYLIMCLAAALLRSGAIEDALETVEQALNFNPEDTVGRPETLRIRGELRLKQGNPQVAEVDFRDSIAMARGIGAKAWELRTTVSLARLLAKQDRREEACARLREIYNWFTEGFDTADLKDAKALLDELTA